MSTEQRRRDYFIKKWLQTRLIVYYLAILAVGGTVLGVYVYRFAKESIRFEMFKGHSTSISTWGSLQSGIIWANTVNTVIVIGMAILVTLIVTGSTARACRIIIKNLNSAMEGGSPEEWQPVRRPQEFQKLQTMVADALHAHRDRVGGLRRTCSELQGKVRQAGEAGKAEGGGPAPGRLRDIHVGCENLKNAYGVFKLG